LIAAHFKPDLARTIFLYFNGKNCPQVYNPDFAAEFPTLDTRVEQWLQFANLNPILSESEKAVDPSAIHLGSEPVWGWCYYYEKADLARQTYDWQSVRELGDKAIFRQGLTTSLDTELMPYILGYALGGDWQKATELMNRAMEIRAARDGKPDIKLMESTWEFIEKNTPESAGRTEFRNMITRLIGNP